MYLYKGHSASTPLGKAERVDEESDKNDIERMVCSQKVMFLGALQKDIIFNVKCFEVGKMNEVF